MTRKNIKTIERQQTIQSRIKMVTVSQSSLPYFLLALMGSSNLSDDEVQVVNIDSDNFDGSVTVPNWLLGQAAGSGFGYVPVPNEDDPLPSTIKMDSDWYRIRVDLSTFDQDKVRVKIVDGQTIRIEAKQRYINKYGAATLRTFTRRFPVPRSYDIYNSDAQIDRLGVLTVKIPNKSGDVITITKNVMIG